MIYAIIFIGSILVALIYDLQNYSNHFKDLKKSYNLTFKFIKNQEDSNILIRLSLQQIQILFYLILKFLIAISPLIIIVSIANLLHNKIFSLIFSLKLNLAMSSGFLFYYLLKKYAKK